METAPVGKQFLAVSFRDERNIVIPGRALSSSVIPGRCEASSPESITPVPMLNMTGTPIASQLNFVVMDSGPAPRGASRNDGGSLVAAHRPGKTVARDVIPHFSNSTLSFVIPRRARPSFVIPARAAPLPSFRGAREREPGIYNHSCRC
jgi:hypothetical protein